MPKTRSPYPPEFRQQMIELVNAGRTPAELSREFNVTAQTIANAQGALAEDFAPITDWGASAEYRAQAARNLLKRFYLESAGEPARLVREVA